jgi:hypothetical protein
MRTVYKIKLDIEVLNQEVRYARVDGDETLLDDLYKDLDDLYEELHNAQTT